MAHLDAGGSGTGCGPVLLFPIAGRHEHLEGATNQTTFSGRRRQCLSLHCSRGEGRVYPFASLDGKSERELNDRAAADIFQLTDQTAVEHADGIINNGNKLLSRVYPLAILEGRCKSSKAEKKTTSNSLEEESMDCQ
eukprot:4575566-Amphidinium_carterae.1